MAEISELFCREGAFTDFSNRNTVDLVWNDEIRFAAIVAAENGFVV